LRLEDKKTIVEELHEKFSKSKLVIVTDYKGLDVARMNDLRGRLDEADIDYRVAKNSLLTRASEGTDAAQIADSFKGPNAVAFSYGDPVAPAKVLTEFAKDNDDLEIKIGILDGSILDTEGIKALSSLPSREILLSQLLSTMIGVPTALVRALSDVPRRLLNVLEAVNTQKGEAGA